MKRRLITTWLLVVSVLVQGFVPILADQGNIAASSAFNKYQNAYQAYTEAVETNASLEQISQKLDEYLQAQKAFKEIVPQSSSSQPEIYCTTESSVSNVTSVADSEPEQLPGTYADIASGDDDPSFSLAQRWQSKMHDIFKRLFGVSSGPGAMPLWEKVLWSVGKAILPTMGVVLATSLLAPLTPLGMIIGGILTGATMAGALTYAYEKRMNARYREVKRDDAKIWRDVSVQAVVQAVMAPFNLATGGLFGMMGPTVGNAIGKVALTQAVITFSGNALSSQVGGIVKNIWSTHYFKYPEKIQANEDRIDQILQSHLEYQQPFTEETINELDHLRSEIETMKAEHYTREDAVKDLKRAGVSAVISGFAGSVISDRAYNSTFGRWADKASVKLFGSVGKGKAVSSLFSTMPVNFAGGLAGASLEKSFINGDINDIRLQQQAYARGSPAWEYFERVINEKEQRKDSIDITKSGFDSMLNNFAVHAARLTVDAIKHNVYDGPRAKKAAVEKLYREKDPEWQKASQLQRDYEELKAKGPNPMRYRNPMNYGKALAAHRAKVDEARQAWLEQSVTAQRSEKLPQNLAMKSEIKTSYERDVKLNQMLELGRLTGGDAHLEAMKKVLQAENPELANASDDRMTQLAALAIRQTYLDKFESSSARTESIEEIFEKRRQHKAGNLNLTPQEAKLLEGRASIISPSQYKAALVEKQVYELKFKNTRWTNVEKHMPQIIANAEKQMLEQYNNNWANVLYAEAYANGLARYKYDPEGHVNFAEEMKKVVARIPGMLRSNVLGEYTSEVNKAITSNIIPQDPSNDVEKYMSTYGKTAIDAATGNIINSVFDASTERIASSFFRR